MALSYLDPAGHSTIHELLCQLFAPWYAVPLAGLLSNPDYPAQDIDNCRTHNQSRCHFNDYLKCCKLRGRKSDSCLGGMGFIILAVLGWFREASEFRGNIYIYTCIRFSIVASTGTRRHSSLP
jgi:hypothetical protein